MQRACEVILAVVRVAILFIGCILIPACGTHVVCLDTGLDQTATGRWLQLVALSSGCCAFGWFTSRRFCPDAADMRK